MKTAATIDEVLEELGRESARVRGLPHGQRYRSNAVRRRDELIRVALNSGVRPSLVRQYSGLARSRIYQIRDAGVATSDADAG